MAVVDLSDAEIEKLLAEAESRLASQKQPASNQKQDKVKATTVQPAGSSEPVGSDQAKSSRDVSVRVPEPPKRKNKKVTLITLSPKNVNFRSSRLVWSAFFRDEAIIPNSMTRATIPSWDSCPAKTMIIHVHSYSDPMISHRSPAMHACQPG